MAQLAFSAPRAGGDGPPCPLHPHDVLEVVEGTTHHNWSVPGRQMNATECLRTRTRPAEFR